MTLYEFFDTGSMKTPSNEDGKTYYVPADMTYRDWEKKLVVQKPKGLLKRNKKIDKITINGCLSPGDLINFLKKQNMLGLEAIGNNGYSSSIILKTVESNIDGCNEFIVNAIDNFKDKYPNLNVEKDYYLIIDFSNELLNEGEKYGLEIVKG
ncbi:MAG: hypothetical protein ACLU23_07450 [Eubacterium sp.]